jgi:hypothetical protein
MPQMFKLMPSPSLGSSLSSQNLAPKDIARVIESLLTLDNEMISLPLIFIIVHHRMDNTAVVQIARLFLPNLNFNLNCRL